MTDSKRRRRGLVVASAVLGGVLVLSACSGGDDKGDDLPKVTTPGANEFVAGFILFEETLGQKADDGTPLPDLLVKNGMLPGIKVDKGTTPLLNSDGDLITQGLDGLGERLKA